MISFLGPTILFCSKVGGGDKYGLSKFRFGDSEYEKMDDLIKNSSTRGQHALINDL
jgi:hypothetical protein